MTVCHFFNDDVLKVLRGIPDETYTAVLTDPPYGLGRIPNASELLTRWLNDEEYNTGSGFMGKSWDIVPGPSVWKELLRVTKPGGVMLAFGGSRTFDLMMIAMRLGGWEVYDTIMYMYGSGFPKGGDISKKIDKEAGRMGESTAAIKREIRDRYERKGMTLKEFNEACGFEASGYLRESSSWARVLPPMDKWEKIKSVIGSGNDLDHLFDEAVREIVGYQARGDSSVTDFMSGGNSITLPATDAAKEWDGYGVSLKPAYEPVVVCRKPRTKTYAKHAVEDGTGAIWIDGCRVGTDEKLVRPDINRLDNIAYGKGLGRGTQVEPSGRWPANIILSWGEDEYALRDNVTPEQLRKLAEWLDENP